MENSFKEGALNCGVVAGVSEVTVKVPGNVALCASVIPSSFLEFIFG